jgi:hypothetical protein
MSDGVHKEVPAINLKLWQGWCLMAHLPICLQCLTLQLCLSSAIYSLSFPQLTLYKFVASKPYTFPKAQTFMQFMKL